jgi:hypothetical protein
MNAITTAQRLVLDKLAPVLGDRFYLVGGVAVSAHLEHRTSRDLDLFSADDPTELQPALERVPGVTIESRSGQTLHMRVDGVPVSLIAYRYPLLEPATPRAALPVAVAAIRDLACMKLSAIANRGAARDFWDLHAIVVATRQLLEHWLAEYRRKYPIEDIGHVVRSLVYFGDADAAPLPEGLTEATWRAIRHDFETWTRALVKAQLT